MKEQMIRDAYCKIRSIDNTIPDDVLGYMKDAAIEKLNAEKLKYEPPAPDFIEVKVCRSLHDGGYKPFYVKAANGSPLQIKHAYRDFHTLGELKEKFQVKSLKKDGKGWAINSSGKKIEWIEYIAEIPSSYILR